MNAKNNKNDHIEVVVNNQNYQEVNSETKTRETIIPTEKKDKDDKANRALVFEVGKRLRIGNLQHLFTLKFLPRTPMPTLLVSRQIYEINYLDICQYCV